MPLALIEYITTYGYPTIFGLVFLQELGIPSPFPNELALIFSGYLAFTGRFNVYALLVTVLAADAIGTSILYYIFYHFGPAILKRAPKWLAISRIDMLKSKIEGNNQWKIYVARLIPYVRGYTSVAAGLLRVPPKVFVPAIMLSALTWSCGYVLVGYFAGPKWELFAEYFGPRTSIALLIILILLVVLGPTLYDRFKHHTIFYKIWHIFTKR